MIDTILANWTVVGIPLAVFVATLVSTLWVRGRGHQFLKEWLERGRSGAGPIIFPALRVPSLLWCLFISAYLALAVSALPPEWKDPSGKGLWSFFILSVAISAINVVNGVISLYGPKLQASAYAMSATRNAVRAVVLLLSVLAILELWGVPIGTLLLLVAIIVIAAVVAFRDTVPNLFATIQLRTMQQIEVGDYIKLESGEEGYVAGIGWTHTRIAPASGNLVVIPNSRLMQRTLVNYGRPAEGGERALSLQHPTIFVN